MIRATGGGMDKEAISLECEDGVATLLLNRPEVRNAMNPAMRDALSRLLEQLAVDAAVETVVLRGRGGCFIAGGDLQAFAATLEMDREDRKENFRERVTISSQLIHRLINFPKPLVAVVEGDAAGAGISIALCCDFVLAAADARFSFSHVHVGLPLDLVLSYFLPRAVGNLQARRLAMSGARITADEAHRLGLITHLAEDKQLNAVLAELLATLGRMPSTAITAIKSEFRHAASATLEHHLTLEANLVGECAATEAFEQRVEAFFTR